MAEQNKDTIERLWNKELTREELLDFDASEADESALHSAQIGATWEETCADLNEDQDLEIPFELIHAYAYDTASQAEREIVEMQMELDPAFRAEVDAVRQAKKDLDRSEPVDYYKGIPTRAVAPAPKVGFLQGLLSTLAKPYVRIPLELGGAAAVAFLVVTAVPTGTPPVQNSISQPAGNSEEVRKLQASLKEANDRADRTAPAMQWAQNYKKLYETERKNKVAALYKEQGLVIMPGGASYIPSAIPKLDVKRYSPASSPNGIATPSRPADKPFVENLSPGRTVVEMADVILTWSKPPNEGQLKVFDLDDQGQAILDERIGSTTTYTLGKSMLKPGHRYEWSIESIADPKSRSTAEFQVANAKTQQKINRLKESLGNSPISFARELAALGLLDEAEHYLDVAYQSSGRSPVVKKLLDDLAKHRSKRR